MSAADLERQGDEVYARLIRFARRLGERHGDAAVRTFVDVFERLTNDDDFEAFARDALALRRGEVAEVRARLDE